MSISHAMRPPRAHEPGVVAGRRLLPDARRVLGHDHVRDVGQRHRAVVVDEDGQRRLAVPQRRDRRSDVGGTHRSPPVGAPRRRPRDARRVSATPGDDDRPADDLGRPDRLAQEEEREDDRHRRHERLQRDDPGRAQQPHAVEHDDVGERRREQSRVGHGQDDRQSRPAIVRRQAARRQSWASPIGARTITPPIVAQVVSTSGEWRRRIGAANAV